MQRIFVLDFLFWLLIAALAPMTSTVPTFNTGSLQADVVAKAQVGKPIAFRDHKELSLVPAFMRNDPHESADPRG